MIRGGGGLFAGYVIYSVPNVTTELSGMGDPSNLNIVIATATSNALGLPTSFTVYQTLLQRGILGVRPVTVADVSVAPSASRRARADRWKCGSALPLITRPR